MILGIAIIITILSFIGFILGYRFCMRQWEVKRIFVLLKAMIEMSSGGKVPQKNKKSPKDKLDQLEKAMNQEVTRENYNAAVFFRDEIKRIRHKYNF